MAPRGQNLCVGKGKITLDIIVLCGPPKATVHKQIMQCIYGVKIAWGNRDLRGGESLKRLVRGLIMKKCRKLWL